MRQRRLDCTCDFLTFISGNLEFRFATIYLCTILGSASLILSCGFYLKIESHGREKNNQRMTDNYFSIPFVNEYTKTFVRRAVG